MKEEIINTIWNLSFDIELCNKRDELRRLCKQYLAEGKRVRQKTDGWLTLK